MTQKIIAFSPPIINTVKGDGPGGTILVIKEADESRTSTITRVIDNELKFPVAPFERWIGQLTMFYNGAAGGDIDIDFLSPAGATGRWGATAPELAVPTNLNALSRTTLPTPLGIGAIDGAELTALINFVVQNDSVSGLLELNWAQQVSNATPTIIRANSFIVAHRL